MSTYLLYRNLNLISESANIPSVPNNTSITNSKISKSTGSKKSVKAKNARKERKSLSKVTSEEIMLDEDSSNNKENKKKSKKDKKRSRKENSKEVDSLQYQTTHLNQSQRKQPIEVNSTVVGNYNGE